MSDAEYGDRLLDLEALSEYSCMSKNTLRDYVRTEGLPAFRLKGKILVKRSEFDEWMEARRIKPLDLDVIAEEAIEKVAKH